MISSHTHINLAMDAILMDNLAAFNGYFFSLIHFKVKIYQI